MAATPIPVATDGPFNPTPTMRRTDVDNDLVKTVDAIREAGSKVITRKQRITDKNGTPRCGHRIEIWHCDMNG